MALWDLTQRFVVTYQADQLPDVDVEMFTEDSCNIAEVLSWGVDPDGASDWRYSVVEVDSSAPLPGRVREMVEAFDGESGLEVHAAVVAALRWSLGELSSDDLLSAIEGLAGGA